MIYEIEKNILLVFRYIGLKIKGLNEIIIEPIRATVYNQVSKLSPFIFNVDEKN